MTWILLLIFAVNIAFQSNTLVFSQQTTAKNQKTYKLLLVTIATEETDGLRRLRNSAEKFGHELHIFGLGQKWNGGDMRYMGGGQKVNLLRENLISYKDQEDLVILFVDAYDVIVAADTESILRTFFNNFEGNRIVFGAEAYCWPDRTLASKYPPVNFGERYLNSGLFIGFAKDIFQMLTFADQWNLADADDDQLFYTKLYLDPEIRKELGMALDSISLLFQNLNGAQEFITLQFDTGNPLLYNELYNTHPLIVHGNGPSKIRLNELGNYLVGNFDNTSKANSISNADDALSVVSIAIFIAKPIPYVEEFLESIVELDYPKEKMHLSIHNNQQYHQLLVHEFAKEWEQFYASLRIFNIDAEKEHSARSKSLMLAEEKNANFLLQIDADAHLTNPMALKMLLSKPVWKDIGILSPLLIRPGALFSNFWGAISDTGYYARSSDYVDIVQGNRRGLWNVPFIGSAILISEHKFEPLRNAFTWNTGVDADIAFAEFCRNNGHFMYIDASENADFYGFLVNSDGFSQLPKEAEINLEIYDFPNNRKLWENRYIHPDYFPLLDPNSTVPLACPDVYDFPFLSERYCKEIIEVMENHGKWSDGSHKDGRLHGGYENVPTRDIHMNQVGLERVWLKVLDDYIAPMQEKVFIGFYQRPINSNMMFIVRYKPEEQASLRPHHDASTYSIDVALNRRGVDYEGGGVRYIRYNCTVEADKIGWTMLFPGRLTHLHEGLSTTKGTRYILVSFINP